MVTGILVVISACESPPPPPVKWHTITMDNQYRIELPDYLVAGYDMHEYAKLQYYSLEKEIFLLGIEDAKTNFGAIKRRRLRLSGYFAYVEDMVLQKADTSTQEGIERFTLSEPPGIASKVGDYYMENDSTHESPPLYYRIAVFESESLFLQLVFWMPYDQQCEMRSVVDRITRSLVFL